jgi:tetratricopeptide (TPR) repeat protein
MAAAQLALAQEDTAAALAAYARAVEIYPQAEEALLAGARLRTRSGDREGARRDYETLMSRSGLAWDAAVELARMDLDAGSGTDALRRLDYALSTVPLEPDVEALRGQAYLLLGDDERAYALFQRARALDLRSVEAMVGMARYYLKREDTEEAIYFVRLALKYDPEHTGAQALLRQAEGEP